MDCSLYYTIPLSVTLYRFFYTVNNSFLVKTLNKAFYVMKAGAVCLSRIFKKQRLINHFGDSPDLARDFSSSQMTTIMKTSKTALLLLYCIISSILHK